VRQGVIGRAVVGAVVMAALARPVAATETAAVRLSVNARKVVLESQDAVVSVRRARHRLTFALRRGGKLVREAKEGGLFYERAGVEHELGRVTDAVASADGVVLTVETSENAPATVSLRFVTSRTVEIVVVPPQPETVTALGERWRSPKREVVYGLTERLRDSPLFVTGVPEDDVFPQEVGSLDRRGETVEMFIRPTFSLYTPFYQTSKGYGLLVGGTTPGVFDVASHDAATEKDPQRITLRFETGTTAESRRLVLYLFAGPDAVTILDEYTHLVGRPFVPPDWAFLHWRWRGELRVGPPAMLDGTPVNFELADDVLMYEALGIPPGVYLFDRPVLVGEPFQAFGGWDRFAWDEGRLPNPDAMLQSLRTRGYRLMMWSAAWACGTDPGDNGIEALSLGFLAPGPGGEPRCGELGTTSFILDVTNPDARVWFRDRLAPFLAANDIRGIKLDRGEEHIASEPTDIWADGRTGREVHNDYVHLQTILHHDTLAQAFPDGDFTLVTRSGYTGTSAYSTIWGGDIPASELLGSGAGTDLGLRSAIISQQRAAFMGAPIWGSDTGGYYEFKDREVFARWLAFSCFSGLMEIGGVGTHAPWDMPTEPAYDQEMIDIYRKYTVLRETLLPYVVAAAAEASTGVPIVRPMTFENRKDKRLRDRWDQYLFGPDLLVAPVWRVGQRSREVYLPKGRWRSYWDPSQVWKGRRTITVEAPLDHIPVFVRDGAQVPGP
jgi:alpha-glucosidase (family GH31 glycosyl hydrolase)